MTSPANLRPRLSGNSLNATQNAYFMGLALAQAQTAFDQGEVPVGAVLVSAGVVIGEGRNQAIQNSDPTAHAEVMAIRDAGKNVNNYRLTDTSLYVTLEPCVMCAGAILHARVGLLIYGAKDPRWGAVGSIANVLDSPLLNHRCQSSGGVRHTECSELLSQFFVAKREKAD